MGKVHADQTGKFVAPSSDGNNYLFILCGCNGNSIHAEPMHTRTAKSVLTACQTVHAKLCAAAGLHPKLQCSDNECSDILKAFMDAENVEHQLVLPHVHQRNAAERAICTFKNHFIAGLCSVDKDFPIHLWDRLLPQALLMLNLLLGSHFNPKLSAWAQLNSPFDFNPTPIAPPGIHVLVHDKPSTHTSWSPHALDGWYLGPASESHQCCNVWIRATGTGRICNTVSWFPTEVTVPSAWSTDMILAGMRDILHALHNPSPNSPLAPLTDSHAGALKQLMSILHGVTPSSEPVEDVIVSESALPSEVRTVKPIATHE